MRAAVSGTRASYTELLEIGNVRGMLLDSGGKSG